MAKRIILSLLGLLLVVGFLGGVKVLQIRKMIAQGAQFAPPPETITTAKARAQTWETVLTAVGSLEAVQGVMVTAEAPGKVVQVLFKAGARVSAGDLLTKQDTVSEEAQLRAAEAAAVLAKSNLERIRKLLPEKVVSQSDFDNAEAQYKQAVAQQDNLRAIIDKKNIRAPFAGRLGIRMINLGQVLSVGEPIVSLQALDPIYINFMLPQHQLNEIKPGLTVRINNDAIGGNTVEGRITVINPEVDSATRNVRLQAIAENKQEQLRPGMFVNVTVVLPASQKVLAVPSTAILYAPYSNSVFVVEEKNDPQKGKTEKVVRQQFVKLGEKRGDFVIVESGLKEGDIVVSTGVFKLRNGQGVVVDNTLSPKFKLSPEPMES